jgi:hypothetical protein
MRAFGPETAPSDAPCGRTSLTAAVFCWHLRYEPSSSAASPCAGTGCRTATRSCPACGARRCGWPASGRCSGAGAAGGATPAPAPPVEKAQKEVARLCGSAVAVRSTVRGQGCRRGDARPCTNCAAQGPGLKTAGQVSCCQVQLAGLNPTCREAGQRSWKGRSPRERMRAWVRCTSPMSTSPCSMSTG